MTEVTDRVPPWCTPEVEQAAETDPYAEFAAWELWVSVHLDDVVIAIDEDPIVEPLNVSQRIYLYNVMQRLFHGWPTKPSESASEPVADLPGQGRLFSDVP